MQAATTRRPRRRCLTTGLVAASLGFTAACGGGSSPSATVTAGTTPSAFPVTLQTSQGPVTITSKPTAIVSLSPTATEDLYAIGAGSQVKAVDKYSDYPAGTPKTNLSELQLNVESLLALEPDLVIVPDNSNNLSARMKALSIPVLVLPSATKIDDVYSQLSEIGKATGHAAEAAAESASIRAQLQKIAASVPPRAKPLTYYYELSPDFYSITSDTFVGQLLRLIGLRSIADSASGAAKSGGYPQLSSEFIVKADPDFVFLADTICCRQSSATVAARPGWSQIAAVKHHAVVGLNDDIASRWGPRIVDLLQTAADAVSSAAG
ncbi:MAG TPA: ABC transporter substrate-binding protein [Mycobacteriales bacterium]|nr:ABC transporter substrate-binding protein [Mycobacteriales bacterium]